jgi:hypothetical protein
MTAIVMGARDSAPAGGTKTQMTTYEEKKGSQLRTHASMTSTLEDRNHPLA